jgi:uncharacterized protein with HEPN domain
MLSKRNPVVYLHDILTAIDRINEYVGGLPYSTYEALYEKQDAVERRLSILCEAVDRLRKSGVALEADIDWRSIQSFGNVLRHDHDSVSPEIVWNIIQVDLPVLRCAVETILREHFPDVPRSV